jgi:hypothetical protein
MSSAGLRLEGREKDGKVQLFDTRRWCLVITEEEYDREREIEREIVLHEGKAFTDCTVLCVWRNTGLRPCRFILESEQLDVHSDLALFILGFSTCTRALAGLYRCSISRVPVLPDKHHAPCHQTVCIGGDGAGLLLSGLGQEQ